jgi:hypothetical protein
VIAGLAVSVAAEKPVFSKNQKAFYLNENELNFVRPGLVFKVLSASIDSAGLIRYSFKITDPKGVPLDRNGVVTPGAVRVRAVVATIPRGQQLYTAYTTRPQASTITGNTVVQASFEETQGTYQQTEDGQYTYTFMTRAPANFDRTATHTIAAWAQRDLSEFDLGTQFDTDTFDFVPSGGEVLVRRDIISDVSCNRCHGQLSAHDNRTEVALCITCHQPQSVDPDTGNSVDFATMVHKIHMGENLPSVEAGKPYQIIGFGLSVHDFSDVVFPADVRNCEVCHDGGAQAQLAEERLPAAASSAARLMPTRSRSGSAALSETAPAAASQASKYLTNPSRRACGSCHDNVNFNTGENHAGLPQVSDNQCGNCHFPQGELEFDLSIKGAHTVPRLSQTLPGTKFEILGVSDTAPGKKPTVRFSIKNDKGDPVAPSSMGRLALLIAGNTTDFSEFYSENALTAQGNAGTYLYTFQRAIPDGAQGTWAVGIEGYQNVTLRNREGDLTVRNAGLNRVFYFPVTDTQAKPRRAVVALEKCNACHLSLEVHGSNRNNVEFCVLCHNPNQTDIARRTEAQLPAESINFKVMIHKIHTGEELQIPFTVHGFGGAPNDYTEVRFPGDRRDCTICHIDGTQNLPLQDGLLATTAPRDYLNPLPPISGACLSCHTTVAAAAHADVNTSAKLGEACVACHGPQAEFSVDRIHAR